MPRDASPPRRRSSADSPPRRRRSNTPRGSREATSLLVRNISRDTRPEDLKGPFERYGAVKDVYLPKDYYTGEPRGFGFVQFLDARDAIEAQYKMNHQVVKGREVTVVFAEETRKKPSEMKMKESTRPSSRRSPRRGRSRSRSPRHRSRTPPRHRSRSPPRRSPRRYRSRSRSPRRRHSRSPERRGRDKPFYASPGRSRGPSSGYQRDHLVPHSRGDMIPGYPPFVGAIPRFDMFGQMHPPYPPYHPGANRLWGDV